MSLPDGFLDDLRDRLEISEVVGRRVPLKRKGREWTACCPFHKEKTPSFFVNDEKDFYHCFGCGKHGDHIGFLMETDGFSFIEAVKELADMAGVAMPQVNPREAERAEVRKSLKEVIELATKFFEVSLRSPKGISARGYLEARGIRAETVKKFRLGFAPTGELVPAMLQRGARIEDLVSLGLLRVYEDRKEPVEVFRNRLMFPITDRSGAVIAFGGRLLGAGEPKYLNSPETDLFSKGRVLYGLAQARRAAFDAREIIVAEGYMDVIALSQAGLAQAVAPLGTAVTEDQLKLLWKMVPAPTFALDGDSAGRKAAQRAMERALPVLQPGLSLKFAWLPDGEDPDSIIKKQGLGALTPHLHSATPLSEFLWQSHFEPDPGTPEARAGAWRNLLKQLEELKPQNLRATFQADMEQRYATMFGVRQVAQTTAKKEYKAWPKKPLKPWERSGLDRSPDLNASNLNLVHEYVLLALILERPEPALEVLDGLHAIQLQNANLKALLDQILEGALRLPSLDKETLANHVQEAGFGAIRAQLDTTSMRTTAGIEATDLSNQEFSAKLQDVWAKLAAPAPRPKPRLRAP